ncbi:MAG: hypothetical protein K2W96_13430 [Gemmataceae bacterium]|nr:hypothetical protein [Gemmataceae bacterium]
MSGTKPIRVRFRNDGGKAYARAEAHLVYKVASGPTKATFAWTEEGKARKASHVFKEDAGTWDVPTGKGVRTEWVELAVE